MNKIGVILKINIKSAILIMNNFGAKNCTLLTNKQGEYNTILNDEMKQIFLPKS